VKQPNFPVENTTEWLWPGTEYLGPGTHVLSKIRNGVKPTSPVDAIAQQHDLDYIKYKGDMLGKLKADLVALVKSAPIHTVQSTAMRAGLTLRSIANVLSFGNLAMFD